MLGTSVIHSCVSSAYKLYLMPYRCAMIPKGWVYIVNTRGPRTEPCGTPYNKNYSHSTFCVSLQLVYPYCTMESVVFLAFPLSLKVHTHLQGPSVYFYIESIFSGIGSAR